MRRSIAARRWEEQSALATWGASTALRALLMSEEGHRAWTATGSSLTLEQLCHVINETRAGVYGLIISKQFTTVLSSFNRTSSDRMQHDQTEVERGLCFWCDGCSFRRVEDSAQWLALLHTLPLPGSSHPLPLRHRLAALPATLWEGVPSPVTGFGRFLHSSQGWAPTYFCSLATLLIGFRSPSLRLCN